MTELPRALQGSNLDALLGIVGEEGRRWEHFSPTQLVGLIGSHGVASVREAASAEILRRLTQAVEDGAVVSGNHAGRLEELTHAGNVRVAEKIRRLTLAVSVLAITAVLLGAVQAGDVFLQLWRHWR